MFCPNCGSPNADGATQCSACGTLITQQPQHNMPAQAPGAYPSAMGAAPVPNYMVPAVLTTLLCCMPFGVAAIVQAASVNAKAAAGDLVGAQVASAKAKKFALLGFAIGLPLQILFIALQIALEA